MSGGGDSVQVQADGAGRMTSGDAQHAPLRVQGAEGGDGMGAPGTDGNPVQKGSKNQGFQPPPQSFADRKHVHVSFPWRG